MKDRDSKRLTEAYENKVVPGYGTRLSKTFGKAWPEIQGNVRKYRTNNPSNEYNDYADPEVGPETINQHVATNLNPNEAGLVIPGTTDMFINTNPAISDEERQYTIDHEAGHLAQPSLQLPSNVSQNLRDSIKANALVNNKYYKEEPKWLKIAERPPNFSNDDLRAMRQRVTDWDALKNKRRAEIYRSLDPTRINVPWTQLHKEIEDNLNSPEFQNFNNSFKKDSNDLDKYLDDPAEFDRYIALIIQDGWKEFGWHPAQFNNDPELQRSKSQELLKWWFNTDGAKKLGHDRQQQFIKNWVTSDPSTKQQKINKIIDMMPAIFGKLNNSKNDIVANA